MKHNLEIEIETDCILFGLLSQEPDHRLCWMLNRNLGLNLAYFGEHMAVNRKRVSHHAHFRFVDESNQTLWRVLDNQDFGKPMIPEFSKMDYFLVVEQPDHLDADKLHRSLKELPMLLGCYLIDHNMVKNRENLIFE